MGISTVTELWHRAFGTEAGPSWLALASGVVALAAIVHDPTWRVTRNVVTIVHEGGHAVAALATGRQLYGIRLHSVAVGALALGGRWLLPATSLPW